MRCVSLSRWSVWLLGVGAALCFVPALLAEDTPVTFPSVPPATFGSAEALSEAHDALQETVQRLTTLAETAKDPMLRAELRLAAANVILSKQLEIPCTRFFWGLASSSGKPTEPEKLRRFFDTAEKVLGNAKADLDEARKALAKVSAEQADTGRDAEDEDADGGETSGVEKNDDHQIALKRYSKASSTRRTLLAFHQAIKTALLPPDGGDADRASRRAASELSALMEHDDTRVATAANFWQALLRRAEPDATAALSRLSYALDDVPSAERPYAFFSRVLRCLVLAGHDRRIAALTLLAQMEERAIGWFSDDAERDSALRGIVWTRVHLLRQWHDSLDAETKTEERQWCRERVATLIEAKLGDPNLLPLLAPAIPVLLEPEKMESAASGSP